jgi:lipid-binding SYLF domain-containing protein
MDLFEQQEHLKPYFAKSHACVVFGTIAKAGFYVGGARGKGDVYLLTDNGHTKTKIGHSELRQVSAGFQLGGQVLAEIIFFQTYQDLETFQSGNVVIGADANAVALTASASTKASTMGNQPGIQYGWSAEEGHNLKLGTIKNTILKKNEATTPTSTDNDTPEPKYTKGTAIFTVPLGGFMVEASISGQKFTYKDLASADDMNK